MKRENVKKFAKQSLLFLLQIVLTNACFIGNMFPIGISFAIIRIFYGANLLVVCGEYAVSYLVAINSLSKFFILIYEIIILSLYYFSLEVLKTKRKVLRLLIFVILASALELYFSISENRIFVYFIINFAIRVASVLYFYKLYSNYKKKFIFHKFSNFDYLLFSIFVFLISVGLFRFDFILNYLGVFIISFVTIFFCKFLQNDKYLISGIIVSLVYGVILNNLNFVLFGILSCLLIVNFTHFGKYFFLAISLIIIFGIMSITLEFSIQNSIGIAVAGVVFLCMPQKLLYKLSNFNDESSVSIINEKIQEERTNEIMLKLKIMEKTLRCMKNDFRFLVVGNLDRSSSARELAKDLRERCCGGCVNYSFCSKSNINREEVFSKFLYSAIQNNGVNEDEINAGFKTYCINTGNLISQINHISRIYLEYENGLKKEDESKFLISAELENFAKLFSNYEKMLENSSKINKNLSLMAKEILLNNMIDVSDIAFLENNNGLEQIKVIADNELICRHEMIESLQKIVKSGVKLAKIRHLELSGLSLATFIPNNMLDVSFAIASKSKELKNGDNVTVVKLDTSRYFIAIADGMGHGTKASKLSAMVLNLVRSFFAIGIDAELIAESVNQLLLPVGLDNFSTLDACILDTNSKECCFVKLGSSVSVLKHKNTSEIIASDSLPIGIVQNVKPTISIKRVIAGDTIFLASDGVVDSFSDVGAYKTFINDARIFDLQKYVDDVIADLSAQPNKHRDDMTIIAVKLLKN